MAPHDYDADAGLAGVAADRGPIARQPQVATRHSELAPEPPAAPRRGPCGAARRMHARVTEMLAHAARDMVRDAMLVGAAMEMMLVGRAVKGMVSGGTRLRV